LPTSSARTRRSRVKIADEIIESLRQEIVTGRLPHGERMPTERELADRYGVSQPTIREAIRALDTLGLVEVQQGSGSYVRGRGNYALALSLQTLLQLESVEVMEVFDVRQMLGKRSAEFAALNATGEDVRAIRASVAALDDMQSARDIDEVTERVIAFQHCVSAAAHKPLLHSLEIFLISLLIEVQLRSLRKRGLRFWRLRASEFREDRHAILAGIESRSAPSAVAAMQRYLDHLLARFAADQALRDLKLSDPGMITAIAEMVQQLRAS
jgi:GntR family transcriptional repressor for pyruvate dehydrogenase complex